MKRILFLFTASLWLLACSNDDVNNGPDGPQELQIKKFVNTGVDANGTPTGASTEYFFDENGTFTQKKIVDTYWNETEITNYTYNQVGQFTEIQTTSLPSNLYLSRKFYYDSQNRLDSITNAYNEEPHRRFFHLTYGQNKIEITDQHFFNGLRVFNYNNLILSSIDIFYEGHPISEQIITYDSANNITERSFTGSDWGLPKNHTYLYDDKINPLYPYFNERPSNLLGEHRFDLNHCKLFFSPNNCTSEVVESSEPELTGTFTKTFQYNNNDYPISAIVKRDGVLIEEWTYEYY